jgi:hypothetical protein
MEYEDTLEALRIKSIEGRIVILEDLSKWIVLFKYSTTRVWRELDKVFLYCKAQGGPVPTWYMRHIKRNEAYRIFFLKYLNRPFNGVTHVMRKPKPDLYRGPTMIAVTGIKKNLPEVSARWRK